MLRAFVGPRLVFVAAAASCHCGHVGGGFRRCVLGSRLLWLPTRASRESITSAPGQPLLPPLGSETAFLEFPHRSLSLNLVPGLSNAVRLFEQLSLQFRLLRMRNLSLFSFCYYIYIYKLSAVFYLSNCLTAVRCWSAVLRIRHGLRKLREM